MRFGLARADIRAYNYLMNNTNRTEGSKYLETQNLRATELAKLIRKDLKALALTGVKFSVRCGGSSMHDSIDVEVTAVPSGFEIYTRDRTLADAPRCWLSDRANELLETVKAVVNSYNYDGSDLMSDYFDVRFYDHVGFSHELRQADREARDAEWAA